MEDPKVEIRVRGPMLKYIKQHLIWYSTTSYISLDTVPLKAYTTYRHDTARLEEDRRFGLEQGNVVRSLVAAFRILRNPSWGHPRTPPKRGRLGLQNYFEMLKFKFFENSLARNH